MTTRPDILILGAGVVGLSAARRLLLQGARVTVLDPANPGGQGSRAAAGVAIPSVRVLEDPALQTFADAAKSVLAEDLDALGGAGLRRGSGIVRPMPDDKARLALESKVGALADRLGRWAPPAEVAALEPALAGAPIAGAFVNEEGYMVDSDAYVSALLHDVSTRGGEVRLGEAALVVTDSSQGVEVRTVSGTLKADWLVVAAGAWSGSIPGLAPLPVKPLRGQLITVFHPRVRLTRIVSSASYLAPWRQGQVAVGATEEDAGFACYTTPAGLLHLMAAVARLAPVMRDARFVTSWAGLRSAAPGGRPLIGRYPGTARTLVATGHGGQGIVTGGLTGRVVEEIILNGRSEIGAPFQPGA